LGQAVTLRKKGKYWFGDSQGDIRQELSRYSKTNGYPVDHFADAVCGGCGGRVFELDMDENEGVAGRVCAGGGDEHLMADGEQYLEDAELEQCVCVCGAKLFEITAGVHLYRDEDGLTEDVRWFYVGCRCPKCGMLGCYGDWKNEYIGFRELLSKV